MEGLENASDVDAEGSGIPNEDLASLPVEDGPGPSHNGYPVIASDAESVYSGITNEDDEDLDDLEDDEGLDWSPRREEAAVLSPKEEELSADEDPLIGEEVPAEELLSVKEEMLSDVSDNGFTGFDVAGSGPAKWKRGLSDDVNMIEEQSDDDFEEMKSEEFGLESGGPKFEVTDSNSENLHPEYKRGTVWPPRQNEKKHQYPFKTFNRRRCELYHCYYCPVSFMKKYYLSRHVVDHLEQGSPEFEVTDLPGKNVHTVYVKDGGKYYYSNPERCIYESKRMLSKTDMRPFKCHSATNELGMLRAHLKGKAKRAPMPFLTCSQCGWTTKWKQKLEVHMRRHLPGTFQCKLCIHNTNTYNQLELHMISHTGEKRFACHLCGQRFALNPSLKKHLTTHKSQNHQCPRCKFFATEPSALTEHIKNVHTGPKNYSCPKCKFEARGIPILRSHYRSIHGKRLEKVKCRYCNFKSVYKHSMVKHERSHTLPGGYACDQCAYVGNKKISLVSHKMMHTGEKPFACDLCAYRSTSRSGIARHLVVHNDVRPFKCSLCDKSFKTKQAVRLHEDYTHKLTTEKYHCVTCVYETNQKHFLKRHLLTHNRYLYPAEKRSQTSKPHPCTECDYVGREGSRLKAHMKNHKGDRQHKCDLCNFRSVSSGGVTTHMKYVHPTFAPYACEYCNTTFRFKPELIDHERLHTGRKKKFQRTGPYKRRKCQFCNFETVPFRKLKLHYEQLHPDRMKEEIVPELVEREALDARERKNKPKRKRKCRFCNFESTVRRTVRLHEQKHTYEIMGKIDDKVMRM